MTAATENIFYGVGLVPIAISPERRTTSPTSWDTLSRTYLVDGLGDVDTMLAEIYPEGGAHPQYPQMYIEKADPIHQGNGVYEVAVSWKGILNDKGYRRTQKVFGETSTGENIASGLGAPYPSFIKRIKVEQPVVSVETTYIRTGEPSQAGVKKPVGTLPEGFPALPTPPAQVWSFISDPTYVYPAGWVLDSRDPVPLNLTNLYMVTDRHIYRFPTEM